MSNLLEYEHGSMLLYYQIEGSGKNKYISIDGTNSYCDSLTFPKEIDGIPVTTIGVQAFHSSEFKKVTFHENIKFIDNYAFYNSTIEEAEFSEGLEEIGDYAFGETSLFNIALPDSLKIIGNSAFSSSGLSTITFGKNIESIGEEAFSFCNFVKFSIPDSVKEVQEDIIFSNLKLENLYIGQHVKILDDIAYCCPKLKTIMVHPKSIHHKVVDDVLYSGDMKTLVKYPSAKKDTAFRIPKAVKELRWGSFGFCKNLTDIHIGTNAIDGFDKIDTSINDSQTLTVHCRPNTEIAKHCSENNIPMLPFAGSEINEFVKNIIDKSHERGVNDEK